METKQELYYKENGICLNAFQGDDFILEFNIKDENDNIIDLTDFELKFSMKKKINNRNYDHQIVEILNTAEAVNGVFQIKILNTLTETFIDEYYFDIQLKDLNNIISTINFGVINFIKDITN